MKTSNWKSALLCVFLLIISLDSFAQHPGFDSPDKVPLGGLVREDVFNSPLGPIHLRWTREVEKKFGRNPLRATMDAATAVSRVLRLGAMPTELQNFSVDWTIAFMDSLQENAKFPKVLFDLCHPGWMLPPAHVYIVGERIYAGCSGRRGSQEVADELLSKVVVHELAHVVEFHYFGPERWRDRARKEGFARWFELLASKNSSLIDESSVRKTLFTDADRSFAGSMGHSFSFDGSAESYSRMASYFAWIESRYGLAEIFRIYEDIRNNDTQFFAAVEKRSMLSRERLDREVHAFVTSQLR
jgi:hypothetical protein